ncbi:MAG: hypothetical protein ACTSSO_06595 [Candidatus Hodarchaeales archaeon]
MGEERLKTEPQSVMLEYNSRFIKYSILFWIVMLNLLGIIMTLGESSDIVIGSVMLIVGILLFIVVWKAPVTKNR